MVLAKIDCMLLIRLINARYESQMESTNIEFIPFGEDINELEFSCEMKTRRSFSLIFCTQK